MLYLVVPVQPFLQKCHEHESATKPPSESQSLTKQETLSQNGEQNKESSQMPAALSPSMYTIIPATCTELIPIACRARIWAYNDNVLRQQQQYRQCQSWAVSRQTTIERYWKWWHIKPKRAANDDNSGTRNCLYLQFKRVGPKDTREFSTSY